MKSSAVSRNSGCRGGAPRENFSLLGLVQSKSSTEQTPPDPALALPTPALHAWLRVGPAAWAVPPGQRSYGAAVFFKAARLAASLSSCHATSEGICEWVKSACEPHTHMHRVHASGHSLPLAEVLRDKGCCMSVPTRTICTRQQPFFARLPLEEVSCAERRHPILPAQRINFWARAWPSGF